MSQDARSGTCGYQRKSRHKVFRWRARPNGAKDLNRPEIQRLLADIASGSIDFVLVWKLDRLSRRLRDLNEVLVVLALLRPASQIISLG
ncbi:MAG TPA: recombinase family protein [Gemmatimonadota bacterium]|nr:recombinase family protein [Gemmatimonadota bacterium]